MFIRGCHGVRKSQPTSYNMLMSSGTLMYSTMLILRISDFTYLLIILFKFLIRERVLKVP